MITAVVGRILQGQTGKNEHFQVTIATMITTVMLKL